MTGQPSVAEVLVAHTPASPRDGEWTFLPECRCGWLGTSRLAWAVDHARHVNDYLAAAGLLASGPTLADAWDRGVGAFSEAWEQDRTEPWSHLPENPYRTTETKGDDRG